MKRFFALLLGVLLLGACLGQVVEVETTIESTTSSVVRIPSVRLISNGEEHEPYRAYLFGTYYWHGQLITDDAEIRLDKVDELPEIQYADDFQIVINTPDQVTVRAVRCAPYKNDYESIWALHNRDNSGSVDDFSFPDEPGLYLLSVETYWTNGEEDQCYANVFKIRK